MQNNEIKEDIIYKAALTFKHEELAGMYALCNKREHDLNKENARLREALEFYANEKEWEAEMYWSESEQCFKPSGSSATVLNDQGETARKALENYNEVLSEEMRWLKDFYSLDPLNVGTEMVKIEAMKWAYFEGRKAAIEND